MEVSKVKIINKWDIADLSKDESLVVLIPHYKEVAEEYCHRSFNEPIPSRVQEFIAKMIDYHNPGLSSRSMGTVSYSFDADHEKKLYDLIKPLRKVNWGGKDVH